MIDIIARGVWAGPVCGSEPTPHNTTQMGPNIWLHRTTPLLNGGIDAHNLYTAFCLI